MTAYRFFRTPYTNVFLLFSIHLHSQVLIAFVFFWALCMKINPTTGTGCHTNKPSIGWVSIRQRLQRHSSVVSIIARRKLQLFGHAEWTMTDWLKQWCWAWWMETEQEDGLPDGGSTTSLTGVGARFLLQSIWQWTELTQWNEKIDDVVAGLDGPSGLWVHGWMDG